jgi:hypothetical protein
LEEELGGKNACNFENMAKGMQLTMKVQWVPPILKLNGKVTIRVFEKME